MELKADVVTVQGREAGGHVRGSTPLLTLLTSVLTEVSVPVLAAGGISDASAFAEVLAAGAAGARIGTRFIASDESGAHPDYVAAILNADPGRPRSPTASHCARCARFSPLLVFSLRRSKPWPPSRATWSGSWQPATRRCRYPTPRYAALAGGPGQCVGDGALCRRVGERGDPDATSWRDHQRADPRRRGSPPIGAQTARRVQRTPSDGATGLAGYSTTISRSHEMPETLHP